MEEINLIRSLSSILMLLVLLSIVMGIGQKLYSILLALFAFPTYLGLYFMESWLPFTDKSGRKIFSLNIPRENPKKAIMNVAASFITLNLLLLSESVLTSIQTSEEQLKLLDVFIYGNEIPQALLYLFIASLSTIYVISYFFSNEDKNSSWTKIENLSIPSLWKTIAKNVS